jgi:hypothetical protein
MTKEKGRVRFLLSEDVSIGVVGQLIDFGERFKCFQARIYMSRPLFRLVIQDERIVALQHYEGADNVLIGERDEAPLMTLTARGEESLFRTLVVHFRTAWEVATPVSQL